MQTVNLSKILSLLALSGLALMAGSSQANDRGFYSRTNVPGYAQHDFGDHRGRASIDERQRNQMERIRDGLQSGQLTRFEARQLMQEQKQIERTQRHYLADGRLSRGEWLDLDRLLDQANRNIRVEKHDRNWR